MSAAQTWLDRKTSAAVRSPLVGPPSPHTPQRGGSGGGVSSTFSSPGGSYRVEDEPVLLEFGARHLRAGFAGPSSWAPRCTLGFGIEESRRVGDYRRWLPGYDPSKRRKRNPEEWTGEHELWQIDAQSSNLGLVEDKVERAIREAYAKYLLLEAKSRRVILVASTSMPHPFLSIILSLLFNNFQVPGVALFPPPAMAVLAAGLRSGLVVDIGWHETTVTAVDEFRETHELRSTRAMKQIACQMGKLLDRATGAVPSEIAGAASPGEAADSTIKTHFEYAEEVLMRIAWCNMSLHTSREDSLAKLRIAESEPEAARREVDEDPIMSIPGPGPSSPPIKLKFSTFSKPVEEVLFAAPSREQDDHEQSLPHLVYYALLSLPPDVRGACMSRIVVTGGGSRVPGLKSRLLEEVKDLVQSRGWDPVQGRAAERRRRRLKEIDHNRRPTNQTAMPSPKNDENAERDDDHSEIYDDTKVAAGFEPQTPDPVAEKLLLEAVKGLKPTVSGVVRGVETLGAWVGASLAASLRVKPVVEIEREQFQSQGLAGARRDVDVSVANARQSYGQGLARPGAPDATAWTLGAWA